jgi:hypothetical protein
MGDAVERVMVGVGVELDFQHENGDTHLYESGRFALSTFAKR